MFDFMLGALKLDPGHILLFFQQLLYYLPISSLIFDLAAAASSVLPCKSNILASMSHTPGTSGNDWDARRNSSSQAANSCAPARI